MVVRVFQHLNPAVGNAFYWKIPPNGPGFQDIHFNLVKAETTWEARRCRLQEASDRLEPISFVKEMRGNCSMNLGRLSCGWQACVVCDSPHIGCPKHFRIQPMTFGCCSDAVQISICHWGCKCGGRVITGRVRWIKCHCFTGDQTEGIDERWTKGCCWVLSSPTSEGATHFGVAMFHFLRGYFPHSTDCFFVSNLCGYHNMTWYLPFFWLKYWTSWDVTKSL